MLTPAEAEKLILEQIQVLPPEECPLAFAQGRVLRADIRADRDMPPYDRVTMDGYALRVSALAAGVRTFRVEAVQAAGMGPIPLGPAQDACVEVMTGAVLPTGADAVVPYEDTTREDLFMNVAAAIAELRAGHAVHRRGSDNRAADVIVKAGSRLTGREIAVAAACGCPTLSVSRLPKVAVVATGDELVEVGAAAAAHQVRRSNDYALAAALAAAGYPGAERFHLRDSVQAIEHLLWHVLAEYDVVILSGGVSKGKFDFIPEQLAKQGVKNLIHGIAQRPGKPFWFGISPRNIPVFALPGNPVSAYTCFHRLVVPAVHKAAGLPAAPLKIVALAHPVSFKPKLAYLLPVRLASGDGGELLAYPAPGNTSGDFGGLVGTDGFVELPAGVDEFPAGYTAPFYAWI